MERRNFLTGILAAPFGFLLSQSCDCDVICKPIKTEIRFYGCFTDESLENTGTILPRDPVFVDHHTGCCELNHSEHNHIIGRVADIDENGILVSMNITHPAGSHVIPENWIPKTKSFGSRSPVPSFGWDDEGNEIL